MTGIMLTKHENEVFKSQTVMLSGHAYINCEFDSCTLIVTNTLFLLRDSRFENCNWRLEYDVIWGDPNTQKNIRQILDMIEGAGGQSFSAFN